MELKPVDMEPPAGSFEPTAAGCQIGAQAETRNSTLPRRLGYPRLRRRPGQGHEGGEPGRLSFLPAHAVPLASEPISKLGQLLEAEGCRHWYKIILREEVFHESAGRAVVREEEASGEDKPRSDRGRQSISP